MNSVLTILLATLGLNTILAQVGTVRGVVYDSIITNPVVNANVWLETTKIGTITDSMGRYNLNDIPVGSYSINTWNLGYSKILSDTINIASDSILVHNINLPLCPYFTLGKPDYCPNCGKSDQVVPLIFGEPTKKMKERELNGEIKLAGCKVPTCPPSLFCKRDQTEF
jgi:hypothetical protein